MRLQEARGAALAPDRQQHRLGPGPAIFEKLDGTASRAHPVGVAGMLPRGLLNPNEVGIACTVPPPGPDTKWTEDPPPESQYGPLPGWYAISVYRLLNNDRRYDYFRLFRPVATAGYSIYIWAERRNNVYNSLVGWALARRDSLGDGLKPILQLVPGLADVAFIVSPCLTGDMRGIVFAASQELRSVRHLYWSERQDVNGPFGKPKPIESCSFPEGEAYPTITPDGLEMFFMRYGNSDPFVVRRLSHPTRG